MEPLTARSDFEHRTPARTPCPYCKVMSDYAHVHGFPNDLELCPTCRNPPEMAMVHSMYAVRCTTVNCVGYPVGFSDGSDPRASALNKWNLWATLPAGLPC
jgi:hypothetical protein